MAIAVVELLRSSLIIFLLGDDESGQSDQDQQGLQVVAKRVQRQLNRHRHKTTISCLEPSKIWDNQLFSYQKLVHFAEGLGEFARRRMCLSVGWQAADIYSRSAPFTMPVLLWPYEMERIHISTVFSCKILTFLKS